MPTTRRVGGIDMPVTSGEANFSRSGAAPTKVAPAGLSYSWGPGVTVNPATGRPADLTGNMMDPAYAGLRAHAFNAAELAPSRVIVDDSMLSGPVQDSDLEFERRQFEAEGRTPPVPRDTGKSFDAKGTGADFEGRIRARKILDDAYGPTVPNDPKMRQIEEGQKDIALENMSPTSSFGASGRPPVRWQEEKQRRALQTELDISRSEDERLKAELGSLGKESLDPAEIYKEEAALHDQLMQDPRYSAMDPGKQKETRDAVKEIVRQRRRDQQDIILARRGLSPTPSRY